MSAALAAYILKINIIHLAGGEKTIGSLDDGFRNCITKLANLHFPVAEEYKRRILQMGKIKKLFLIMEDYIMRKFEKPHIFQRIKLKKNLILNS